MPTIDDRTQPGFLYVTSWEVCNRLGGVHSVLQTCTPHLETHYNDDLLFVGPDLWARRTPRAEFTEDPTQPQLAGIAAERDIPVRFGRWEIEGRPRAALVDFGRLLERKNEILGLLWDDHKIDSIHADWDTIERILFGLAAGMLVELHYHSHVRPTGSRAVAHFHQWIAGAGLLRLSDRTPEIGTVYTPHGTALGRSLAQEGEPLHRNLERFEPLEAARERGVIAQHSLEVAVANAASVLTSVSEHSGDEIRHLLGREVDLVTPNGFTRLHDFDPARREQVREAIFRNAERFLGAPIDRDSTRLALSSGPYQVHTKGIDVALKALGKLKESDEQPARRMLYLIAMAANQTGPRPETLRRLRSEELAGEPIGICTHNLAHPEADPILQLCRDAGLNNDPDDPVRVVFVPLMIDGRDPFLPFPYAEVLQACDATLFPSLYEPWGYTPVESLAAGVSTATTDLTGFGRFALGVPEEERKALVVLPRSEMNDEALQDRVADEARKFLALDDEAMISLRSASDDLLARMSWDRLIAATLDAHRHALHRARARRAPTISPGMAPISRRSVVVISTGGKDRPQLHRFTVTAKIPDRIARLRELAGNLWWSWNPAASTLFEAIEPELWVETKRNPIALLRHVDPARLEELAATESFLQRFDAVMSRLDAYLGREKTGAPATTYFCAEFALHESLPIYSGGLGVLAGDHLKSASDLALPLSAVGLFYSHGYFVQRIQPGGEQGAEFVRTDLRDAPLSEVEGEGGVPLRIRIPMPERDLMAGAYRVQVGGVELLLLDTHVTENDPGDQDVTFRLYPSDREPRLRQEILLGMGGWRLLKALGKTPEVCHLNEGHSAFLLLERLLDLVEEQGLTFAEAEEVVRNSTLFTTHTPVPAGHDRFSEGLMRRYFGHVAARLGLDWEEFLDLGRASRDDHEFSMTVLALRLSGRANGVSRLHGEVSRDMLTNVWPGFHTAETPVDSITNGVHLPTWVGPEMRGLIDAGLGNDWPVRELEPAAWKDLEDLDDEALWVARKAQRNRMVEFLRESVERTGLRRGESPAALRKRIEGITEDALWIGYARRFAPYKRATLLFQDAERLAALLDDEERPVRVVFAGKSHPDDHDGGRLVQEIVKLTQDERFAGRVFLVEDYDMSVGRQLVQGVDIWLNTPTRPLEASGTSGMKACLNAGIHLSILDGWWCEGYDGDNGWAIGEGREYDNPEMQREHDSRSLYGLLETDIVPLFFHRDYEGLPRLWLERCRHTLATVPAVFNTNRMVSDYARFGYRPLGERLETVAADEYRGARERAARHARLKRDWEGLFIDKVSVTDLSQGQIGIGDVFEVRARVQPGSLSPEELSVELYIGPLDENGELKDPVVIPLLRDGVKDDGAAEYTGTYLPSGSGSFEYGVRVMPACETFEEAAHLGLVRWA
jgi:phosphorylase/glycogen(starch) synthase